MKKRYMILSLVVIATAMTKIGEAKEESIPELGKLIVGEPLTWEGNTVYLYPGHNYHIRGYNGTISVIPQYGTKTVYATVTVIPKIIKTKITVANLDIPIWIFYDKEVEQFVAIYNPSGVYFTGINFPQQILSVPLRQLEELAPQLRNIMK